MRRFKRNSKSTCEHLLQEQKQQKGIFDKIAHYGVLNSPNIRYLISPKAIFNGDVVLLHDIPTVIYWFYWEILRGMVCQQQ